MQDIHSFVRAGDINLTDIAELSGFNGVSYMSEMFKKSFGNSPLNYRKTWEATYRDDNVTG